MLVFSHSIQRYVKKPVAELKCVPLNWLSEWHFSFTLTDSKILRIGWSKILAADRQ